MRAYFGLVNIIAILILVLHYRNLFKQGWHKIRGFILLHREKIIFGFPLITVLPFAGSAYGIYEDDWCELDTALRSHRLWAFFMYYIWVFVVSFIAIIVLAITCVSLYKAHPKLLYSMFSSTGVYVVCSICAWIPRMFAFLNAIKQENSYIFLYFFGIVYYFIFTYKRPVLTEFERTATGLDSECDSFFSWDVGLSNSLVSIVSVDRSTNSSLIGLSTAAGVSWNLGEMSGSKGGSVRGSGSNRGSALTGSQGTPALPRLSEVSETETTTTAASASPVNLSKLPHNSNKSNSVDPNARPSMLHHLLQAARMSRAERPSFLQPTPHTLSSNAPSQELQTMDSEKGEQNEVEVVHSPMVTQPNSSHVPTRSPSPTPPNAHGSDRKDESDV
ncbi:hypothetical protein EON65_24395 [archaeon]|nr:MAG: hypothetical protein EON65_24395 [archaeon]